MYQCPKCGIERYALTRLKKHMKRKHAYDYPKAWQEYRLAYAVEMRDAILQRERMEADVQDVDFG